AVYTLTEGLIVAHLSRNSGQLDRLLVKSQEEPGLGTGSNNWIRKLCNMLGKRLDWLRRRKEVGGANSGRQKRLAVVEPQACGQHVITAISTLIEGFEFP